MAESKNVDVVKEAYHRFKSGDVATLVSTLRDDVVFHTAGPMIIPTAGTFHGREGVATFFKRLSEAEETLVFEPRLYLSEGNTVAVLGHYEARIRATGRVTKFDWVQVFTLRDGSIVRWEQFFDTAAVADAYRMEAAVSR